MHDVVGGWSSRHWTQQNVDDESTLDQCAIKGR
jgi:hypothetical protein